MITAIKRVRAKEMGLKKASRLYEVPKTSLKRYVLQTDKSPEEVVNSCIGRKPILPKELEKKLVEYLLEMERSFFGMTRGDLRRFAFQLAMKNNIKNPFNKNEETAGRGWYDHFLRRHKNVLSERQPTATSTARVRGFTREALKGFYDLLEEAYQKFHFPATRIYNVDETGKKDSPRSPPCLMSSYELIM